MTVQANRDPATGHFLGGPMPDSLKAAISQGQIRRHARVRLTQGPAPRLKRCTGCRRMKVVPDEYPMRCRKLAGGEYCYYPAGECLKCNAKRSAAWRAELRKDRAKAKAAYKRWNAKRNHEHRARYQREYQRMQRRLAGIPERGPWKKYRGEPRLVPVGSPGPFLNWMDRNRPVLDDSEKRRINAVRAGEQTHLSLELMDRIMTRNGATDQFTIFYGGLPGTVLDTPGQGL